MPEGGRPWLMPERGNPAGLRFALPVRVKPAPSHQPSPSAEAIQHRARHIRAAWYCRQVRLHGHDDTRAMMGEV